MKHSNARGMAWIGLLLVFSTVAAQAQAQKKDYKKAVERVTLVVEPAVREQAAKDKNWKLIVDWFEKKENLEKMFRRIDDQLGVYWKDGLPITITLSAKNTYPVHGRGSPARGTGVLTISVPSLVQFNSTMKADLARVVEIIATHEITHCFQQTPKGETITVLDKWPLWLIEGMACFAGEDDLQDAYLKLKPAINELDAVTGREAYPRGRIFFKYLNETYGAAKVKEFVSLLYNRVQVREAVEKTTKIKWDAFKAAELKWALEYVKKKTG